jgi:hypothetical protein
MSDPLFSMLFEVIVTMTFICSIHLTKSGLFARAKPYGKDKDSVRSERQFIVDMVR